MKLRHVLMVGGVAIAAWLALFGDKTPSGSVAEPTARNTAKASAPVGSSATTPTPVSTSASNTDTGTRKGKFKPEPVILVLQDREELIGGGVAPDPKSAGLFGSQNWTPPPPPPPPPAPPPPPTAPALPYTYLGKKLEDGVWEVYLAHGEHTLVVHEKNTLENLYQVESIKPPTLTLTYLPLKQMQTLTIGGAD